MVSRNFFFVNSSLVARVKCFMTFTALRPQEKERKRERKLSQVRFFLRFLSKCQKKSKRKQKEDTQNKIEGRSFLFNRSEVLMDDCENDKSQTITKVKSFAWNKAKSQLTLLSKSSKLAKPDEPNASTFGPWAGRGGAGRGGGAFLGGNAGDGDSGACAGMEPWVGAWSMANGSLPKASLPDYVKKREVLKDF